MFKRLWRSPWHLAVFVLATGLVACGTPSGSEIGPMSSADLAACRGVPAPRPTPPDIGPDLYYLYQTRDAMRDEIHARGGEFVSMYIDEMLKVIVIGAPHPTKAMCDDLHARFGPWIEVRQNAGVVSDN